MHNAPTTTLSGVSVAGTSLPYRQLRPFSRRNRANRRLRLQTGASRLRMEDAPILRAALICPDRKLAEQLQSALLRLPVALVHSLDHYPPEAELLRLLRSVAPQAILLS